MANPNAARGLVPLRHRDGAPYNGACKRYYRPATDANIIRVGDPVIAGGSADADGVPDAILATAAGGNYLTGAVVGIETLTFASLGSNSLAASTAGYLLVADDPALIFEIQEDSVGGALAAADIGLNADLIAAAGTTYGSGWMLDTSTKATTNTLQLRIAGIERRPDNAIGTNAKVLVGINLHTQRNLTGV